MFPGGCKAAAERSRVPRSRSGKNGFCHSCFFQKLRQLGKAGVLSDAVTEVHRSQGAGTRFIEYVIDDKVRAFEVNRF